jgi:hypothetical protein
VHCDIGSKLWLLLAGCRKDIPDDHTEEGANGFRVEDAENAEDEQQGQDEDDRLTPIVAFCLITR